MKNKRNHQQGQAMITVLYVAVIGIVLTTGALYAHVNNTISSSFGELSTLAHSAAESGVENALLRLIRDPTYTGESLVLSGNRSALVTVTGSSPLTITSNGVVGSVTQRVRAVIHYTGGILVIDSWGDIP